MKVSGGYANLEDMSGHHIGKTSCALSFLPGSILSIGIREVEIDSRLSKEDFMTQRGLASTQGAEFSETEQTASLPKAPVPGLTSTTSVEEEASLKGQRAHKRCKFSLAQNAGLRSSFQAPFLASMNHIKVGLSGTTPRHDPKALNALVMQRPGPDIVPRGRLTVDVVVDPLLSRHLREHQREGVKFLYECVIGLRDFAGQGAILADEMGLGKTLQTITLIWTLLKQNYAAGRGPLIKKALIVCPVTLVDNWRKEFHKWLGTDRIGVWVYDDTKKRIADFTNGKAFNVMIIGYERLRNVHAELRKGHGIDIVIADEGHRLKTAKNKSALAIKSLDTSRRIVLSGTPIQNDLSEFFMMVDFVNPGLLGDLKAFTKNFEVPILKSRQPEAASTDIEMGQMKSDELVSLTDRFILRRSAAALSDYLPRKTEFVLMCRPTRSQAETYRRVLQCPAFQSAMGSTDCALQLITLLRKVCNSPYLLKTKSVGKLLEPVNPLLAAVTANVPQRLLNNQGSTKLRVLDQLLYSLRQHQPHEKIVLVSSWTSTLELFQTLLSSQSYPFVRLDGSTPAAKRQRIIDTFNQTPASECFAFLLSAKSGGVGLNLVGASRLVLFDVDWNPATDLQAMARIHRDGQKRPCFIYRFLMAGGLDEKIWQRQVTKLGLASTILEQNTGASNFSGDELRDLFRLNEDESCQTHDLIGCSCNGRGSSNIVARPQDTMEVRYEDVINQADKSLAQGDLPVIRAVGSGIDVQKHPIDGRASDIQKKRSKQTIDALMAYSHLNTSKFGVKEDKDVERLVHDKVLLEVLKDEANLVSFTFLKSSS